MPPPRILFHGHAPSTSNYEMKAGTFRDLPLSTQFLVDLEFLTLHTERGATCVYVKTPPYMHAIASHFPWVHFYTFACENIDEYDPDQPSMQGDSTMSLQTQGNVTSSSFAFTKETALIMGKRDRREFLVMICHEHHNTMQLVLHALLAPNFSLLDISELPTDYATGQIFLPFGMPRDKCLAFLVSTSPARSSCYSPETFREEIAYVQLVQRETTQYDTECTDFIIDEYAARYQHMLNVPGILLVVQLKMELQGLESTKNASQIPEIPENFTKTRETSSCPWERQDD
jgi:hypothetical protein